MIYCIDIDETLCHSIEDDYAHSSPNLEAIKRVNDLYEQGNTIKLFTGRGSWDNYDWREFTCRQLFRWGVKYHELIMGKPHADVFIDDKALNTADWLLDKNDTLQEVIRDWGKEIIIVNCDEYCSKLLIIPKGAISEYHWHPRKKETFYCLKGHATICVEGREIVVDPLSKPITIKPQEKHSFKGNSNSIILEISTHHEDNDVVFLSEAYNPSKEEDA